MVIKLFRSLFYSDKQKKKKQLINQNIVEAQQLHLQINIQQEQLNNQEARQQLLNVQMEKETQLINNLQSHQYLYENFDSVIPNFLFEKLKPTGVYVSHLRHSIKEIEEGDESENAHLNDQTEKTLQYIGYSKGHEFIINEKIPKNSFTQRILEKDENGNSKTYFFQLRHLYVPDAAHHNDLKFYKIPGLGAYFVVNFEMKNYLNEDIYDQSWQIRTNYLQQLQNYDEEIARVKENQAERRLNLEPDRDLELFEMGCTDEIAQYTPPELAPFPYGVENFVVQIDTINQDREISEDDRNFVLNFCKGIQDSWDKTQQIILENDVQLQLKNTRNQILKEDYEVPEDMPENEIPQNTFEFYKQQIKSLEMTEQLEDLSNHRIIKYQQILQTILYFLGYKKEEINIPGTNLLNWKTISKEIISTKEFQDQLYNISYVQFFKKRGAKPDVILDYQKINRIMNQNYDINVLSKYSQALGLIFRWANLYCELRVEDIIKRKNHYKHMQEERAKQTILAQERVNKRASVLSAVKSLLQPAEQESFDEEAWELEFSQQYPVIVIAEEMEADLDLDYDFDNEEDQ